MSEKRGFDDCTNFKDYITRLLNPYYNSYRLRAFHHGWCGCWLHSSGSPSGHFGWSLQGWQAGEPGESGRWESYVCPVGTYGHRWSEFLQEDAASSLSYSRSVWGNVGATKCDVSQEAGLHPEGPDSSHPVCKHLSSEAKHCYPYQFQPVLWQMQGFDNKSPN